MGILHKHQYRFITGSQSALLRMRNVSYKIFQESQKKNLFNNCSKIPALYNIQCTNLAQTDRPHIKI